MFCVDFPSSLINCLIVHCCHSAWRGGWRARVLTHGTMGCRRLRVAHTCAQGKPSFRAGGMRDNAEEQYAANHGQFMSMVHNLIEGNLESSSYEDQCRALLGAQNDLLK